MYIYMYIIQIDICPNIQRSAPIGFSVFRSCSQVLYQQIHFIRQEFGSRFGELHPDMRIMWLKQCHVYHPKMGMVSLYHLYLMVFCLGDGANDFCQSHITTERHDGCRPWWSWCQLEKHNSIRHRSHIFLVVIKPLPMKSHIRICTYIYI
jgi:hypothetical protein